MFQLRLGPVNQSVLGSTLVQLTSDNLEFCATHPALVVGLVQEYHNADRYFIQALFQIIKFDPTLQLCLGQRRLIRQLRRCLTRLIQQNRENESEESSDGPEVKPEVAAKVGLVLETIRRLMDVSTFFAAVERSCAEPDRTGSANGVGPEVTVLDGGEMGEPEVSQGKVFIESWLHCCQEFPSNRPVLLNLSRLLSISTTSEIICSNFTQPASSLIMAQV